MWISLWRRRRPDGSNGYLERLKTDYRNVPALCHDSVGESQAVFPPLLLPHDEAVRSHVIYVEAVRVAVWCQEDVVAIGTHKRRKVMVELDISVPFMCISSNLI